MQSPPALCQGGQEKGTQSLWTQYGGGPGKPKIRLPEIPGLMDSTARHVPSLSLSFPVNYIRTGIAAWEKILMAGDPRRWSCSYPQVTDALAGSCDLPNLTDWQTASL